MTDEEIIERACEEHRKACHCCQMDMDCDWDIRKRVAVLIREDERERCAKVADAEKNTISPIGALHGAGWAGAAIRIAAAIRSGVSK